MIKPIMRSFVPSRFVAVSLVCACIMLLLTSCASDPAAREAALIAYDAAFAAHPTIYRSFGLFYGFAACLLVARGTTGWVFGDDFWYIALNALLGVISVIGAIVFVFSGGLAKETFEFAGVISNRDYVFVLINLACGLFLSVAHIILAVTYDESLREIAALLFIISTGLLTFFGLEQIWYVTPLRLLLA